MDVSNVYKYMKKSISSTSTDTINLKYYNVLDDDIYLDDANYGGGNYAGYYGGGDDGNYGYGYNNYEYYDDNNNKHNAMYYSTSYLYSYQYSYSSSYSYVYKQAGNARDHYSDHLPSSLPSKVHLYQPSFTNTFCSKILPCSLSTLKIILSLLFFLYCFTMVPATNFNFFKKKTAHLIKYYRVALSTSYSVVMITTIILTYYTFIVSYDKCMSNALDRILRFIWIALVATDVVIATDKINLIIFLFLALKIILDMISLMYILEIDSNYDERSRYYYHFSDDNYILATNIIEYLTWCMILCIYYFSSNMYVSEETIMSMAARHLKPKKKVTKNKMQYEQLNNTEDDDDEEMRLNEDDDDNNIEMKSIVIKDDDECSESKSREDGESNIIESEERPKCLEYQASMCSRLYFLWVYPLLSKGFEKGELRSDDLGSLEGKDLPKASFLLLLEALQQRTKNNTKDSLLTILVKLHWRDILSIGLLIGVSIMGAIGSILVLKELLQELEDHPSVNWSTKYLYGSLLLIGKLVESSFEHTFWMVIIIIIFIINHHYHHLHHRKESKFH